MEERAPAISAALNENPNREADFYDRFAIFWHVLTFGMMALYLGVSLTDAIGNNRFGWQHLALIGLTATQAAIYWYAFVRCGSWPPDTRRLFLNFVVGPAIVLVQQSISPIFANMWWVYFGHNFSGALPPWAAISSMGALLILFFGRLSNWQPQTLAPGAAISAALIFLGSSVFYLFIRKSAEHSEARARLITELQQAYRELAAAREQEAELAALKERERIARDMHDSLGHALVSLSVQLEAAQRLYKKDPERASAQMDEMKAVTRQSMDALRRTLAGLRAPGLGDRTLRQAIQEMSVAVSQRSSVAVNCRIAPEADRLNPTVAEAIWGVTQEALTNIEKHAQARCAEVEVNIAANALALRICDDGVGLPADAFNKAGHYGLRGMRERVEGVGGKLSVGHNAGAGTCVEADIPLI
jgi:signal transduction histidine kinase